MFDYSNSEIQKIDSELEPVLAWSKTRTAETEQLALDAGRLFSCTADRLTEYQGAGFFKRCWYRFSGKHGEILHANESDLISMQKHAWRYLELLNKRDLLLAHSIITVKNNLIALTIKEEKTRDEITRLANKIYERFTCFEDKVKQIETIAEITRWVATIDAHEYEKLPPNFRLLKLARDFYSLKPEEWDIKDIKCFQQAIINAGLPWKDEVTLSSFIEGIIEEIEELTFPQYRETLCIDYAVQKGYTPEKFVLDNISASSYSSLCVVSDRYKDTLREIKGWKGDLHMPEKEAIKKIIYPHIKHMGFDLTVSLPIKDLAVELLHCMRLTKYLSEVPKPDYEVDSSGAKIVVDMSMSQEEGISKFETQFDAPETKYDQDIPQKSPEKLYILATKYQTGKGKTQDLNKALILYHKAAKQGHIEAQYKLGNMYYEIKEIDKHYKKAFEWYSNAAEQGHSDAKYKLGCMYHNGLGVKKSYQKTVDWYNKAMEQGNFDAMYRIGSMRVHGEWFTKDIKKACEEYFMKAAEGGHPDAQLLVAYYYFTGIGVAQDFNKAEGYLLKCAAGKKKTKNEIIKTFVTWIADHLSDNSYFYRGDNIPEGKKCNALSTFLKPFNDAAEHVLLYYDATFFGGGKDGFAIGTESVAWHNYGENNTVEGPFSWEGFNHGKVKGDYIIFKGRHKIGLISSNEGTKIKVMQLLRLLHKISLA
jgi:hypothetical protein